MATKKVEFKYSPNQKVYVRRYERDHEETIPVQHVNAFDRFGNPKQYVTCHHALRPMGLMNKRVDELVIHECVYAEDREFIHTVEGDEEELTTKRTVKKTPKHYYTLKGEKEAYSEDTIFATPEEAFKSKN